jgi:Holliday junction resolvase RusA-like endonuclease
VFRVKNVLTITINGRPIGKARPRFVRRGKFVGVYNCQDTEEGKFKWELLAQKKDTPIIETAIHLYVRFFMPIPASISKKKRAEYEGCAVPHVKKPDLDNLVKFVKDCANGVLWRDDSQVIVLHASKAYHPNPGTEIRVEW